MSSSPVRWYLKAQLGVLLLPVGLCLFGEAVSRRVLQLLGKNAGPWLYVEPRLRNIAEHLGKSDDVDYAGRPISASTAVGYTKVHTKQLNNLISDALK